LLTSTKFSIRQRQSKEFFFFFAIVLKLSFLFFFPHLIARAALIYRTNFTVAFDKDIFCWCKARLERKFKWLSFLLGEVSGN
jgi:hypothetical protein